MGWDEGILSDLTIASRVLMILALESDIVVNE